MDGWIDAADAAERLGVKPATLYSYVSRGVLRRRQAPGGRRSLFDAAQVEELARRGRPRRPPGPGELAIESAITALGADRPYYRGRDALDLARHATFEDVATWLWTPDDPSGRDPSDAGGWGDAAGGADTAGPADAEGGADTAGPSDAGGPVDAVRGSDGATRAEAAGGACESVWRADEGGVAAAVAAQSGLPAGTLPLDRLQLIVTALAVTDPRRHLLDVEGVTATGRALTAGLIDALPPASGGPPRPEAGAGRIAERLWTRLCPHPPEPGPLRALEAALILLADHELAASTVAARVAASVRADPYAVVAAGLGVLGGPLHGGASYGVERMLAEIPGPDAAARAIGDRLRGGERIPGFGHGVYKAGDGRAATLLDLVADAVPGHERLAVARAVADEAARRRVPAMNIDFAVALLGAVAGFVSGAGEAIFAVARTAGWLAHALEEYERKGPLRPRAVYVGPPPPL